MVLSSNQIKFIRSLSQKKYREESGLFVVEGEKAVREALDSDFNVKALYRIEEIGEKAMERITALSSPSPVLAVVEKPKDSPLSMREGLRNYIREHAGSLFLALDGIKDPGNLGTIIRIADWFGISAVFLSFQSVDLYNPKTVQSTMGAIFRVPVIYSDLLATIETFKAEDMPVYATTLSGRNIYSAEKLEKRGMIIMGSESFGISEEIIKAADMELFIPPYPSDATTSESLNAAVATAIVCAEFRRTAR